MAQTPNAIIRVDFVINPEEVARLRAYINALETLVYVMGLLLHGQVPCDGAHDSESCPLCKAKV